MAFSNEFTAERKQPSEKEARKARAWMLRESQVRGIVLAAMAEVESKYAQQSESGYGIGGVIDFPDDGFFDRRDEDERKFQEESNWFPDWSEVDKLRHGIIPHRFHTPGATARD